MDNEIRHPLAHARNERGWPQEELARRIRQAAKRRGLRSGTRGSRVSKWETGRATPDEDESQPLIAEVLGIDYAAVAHLGWPHWLPGQDRPLPLGPHNAVPSLREALMSSLDRRSFIAYTSGSLAVLAYQWAATEPGRFAHFAAPGEVDAEMLDWLEATGTELIRLATERRHRTRHLLGAHLTTVTEFISESRYTPAAGQRLHTLAASLSQAIAWQHFDERRHASAGRFWHAALHNAHTAHQRDLSAGILSDLAYQLLWLGDSRAAADILEHAIPRTQHPAARSLLHLRQARALAALNEGGLCRRALTAAEKALDTPSCDPAPAWCSWMSTAVMRSVNLFQPGSVSRLSCCLADVNVRQLDRLGALKDAQARRWPGPRYQDPEPSEASDTSIAPAGGLATVRTVHWVRSASQATSTHAPSSRLRRARASARASATETEVGTWRIVRARTSASTNSLLVATCCSASRRWSERNRSRTRV
ncbi:XRE family transcriptional regulator [Streptomyces sp. V2]|uniref:helix-turn-helix domain-containing protein n=1 Tax=Streptomyces TaxID=1883 RepID=UPI0006EBD710|nr:MULTISPECIES: helix-turn-helix transcriptional regulator [Streptomyces]PWG15253.1 XRE family transcriptional regulator [Streptomyces sp. V2]QZZ25582.1 helix-turn-helix transcriptional regulator [Streptomyces sp. ST1015]